MSSSVDIYSSNDLRDILSECYRNTATAAKVFLPERFWRPFDEDMHGKIFDLIDNSDNPQKVIAAPRGIGKTSIINLLFPLKSIIYQESHYIVPVSATSDLAMQQSENLKSELVSNELVRKLFGSLEGENFSKKQWVVTPSGYDICIMPRGAGQQIRGLLYRNYRPGIILVDDLEDPEHMDSEDQRKAKKQWFFADLLNSVDRGLGGKWQVIVLGTVLHQDSLLVNLLDSPDWDSVQLELCDDNLESKAPNFMPTREVIKLYTKYKNAGELDVFYREYRNDPVPKNEDATFPQSFFKDYDPTKVDLNKDHRVENVIIVDPAKTTNPRSADSAVVGVGVNMHTQAWYVRDIVNGKLHPEELYTEIINMALRIRARLVGLEVTSLHEFATYPLKNELLRRGVHLEIVELHARGGADEKGKKKRIKSLIPFYRQGLVYHNPQCCQVLEAQLMSFPFAKKWDVMDALGYMPELLEIGERYMLPDFSGEDEYESQAAVEREYMELEDDFYDEPLDNFRLI